jgi:cell division protein FtsL
MKFFALTLLTVTAVVLCLLNVVSARHAYYATAYDIARATRVQRDLEDKRKQLLIDRAALLDPGRLSPIAARHGFKVATADQIVIVGAPQSSAAAPAPAAPPATTAPAAVEEH